MAEGEQRSAATLPENAVHPLNRAEWRQWLAEHHTRSTGVWLVSNKKAAGSPTVEYAEAVEEALCFGWIDSKPRKLDAVRTMLWFSPRKPGSVWSKLNKERVERLAAAGLIAPAGQTKIDAAKGDGSWGLLDPIDAMEMPADLTEALAALPPAAAYFHAFPPSTKRAILQWIQQAKRPDTRAARISETARLAQQNVRANQWTPKQ